MELANADNAVFSSSEALIIDLLNKTARQLSTPTPLRELLDGIVRFVTTVAKCDSCLIYVLEQDELVLQASTDPHSEVLGRVKMKVGQGVTGWVAEHLEPVAIAERAYSDNRFKVFHELPEDRFEALLSVPIVSGGRLVGVINLQNRARRQHSEREIRLIATVGFLMGAKIETARLESENSELLDRLATRTFIDRAKGILQRTMHLSEDEAYRLMRRQSQNKRKSMKEIAETIMQDGDPIRRFQ